MGHRLSGSLVALAVTAFVGHVGLMPTVASSAALKVTKAVPVAVDATSSRPAGTRRSPGLDPFSLLSRSSLLEFLSDLTSIQPYSGWRLSTTPGEDQAFEYLEQTLSRLWFLKSRGLHVEHPAFRTFKGVRFWETRVELTVDGQVVEVPADGSPGHRDRLDLAIRFDSDGAFNDTERNPVVVEGVPLVVRSVAQLDALTTAVAADRVVLLDYDVIDRSVLDYSEAVARAERLLEARPAGVVLITSFSNRVGESHGSFAGDLNAFTSVEIAPDIPILNLRIEDLTPAGIIGWPGLEEVEAVRLTWDVDLLAPGESGYLMARIPGADSSRAVILGAHIDSPNTPGALDNGSGSVALLEVARVLDRSWAVPPVDLYLVWFGGHERGMYGSQNFVTQHSELLDRTIAMLQMDCLGRPLDGLDNQILLESWTYRVFGDGRAMLPDLLGASALRHGIRDTFPTPYDSLTSDNGSFSGLDVPNANMIYLDPFSAAEVHYANHLHDPYDTLELATQVGDVFENMARIMLIAAVELAEGDPQLRVTPTPDRRALFVASHTEAPHMSPAGLTEFGMTLAWEGFDVDVVPYGSPVTATDLADADLVVVLPVHDYPSPEVDAGSYDEAWTAAELAVLEGYVRDGGRLVLTNSAHRLKYLNYVYDSNEDWSDQNALATRFGVSYSGEGLTGTIAVPTASHPLMSGVSSLTLATDNGVRFSAPSGQTLARIGTYPVVSVVEVGDGEVIVLADLGLLGNGPGDGLNPVPPDNLAFWQNLARRSR